MQKDIIFTADPAEMSGKYVAEDLYRNCTDIVPKELSNEFYPDDCK